MKWADHFEPYGDGERSSIGTLLDESLNKKMRNYKRAVAKRYRIVEPELVERQLGTGPYWISTKLDGELWFIVKQDGEVALCAYNGRVIRNTSLVREAEARLVGVREAIVAGELFADEGEAGRPRVFHVGTALRGGAEHALSFHAFDLVEEDGRDMLLAEYGERLARLNDLLAGGKRIDVAQTQQGSAADVMRLYREWVLSDRFEGVVVRSDRGLTYKVKKTFSIDGVVIAYGERITGDVHQVREISIGLLREDGTYQLLGAVGSGLSEQDRVRWHTRLSAMEVPSRFRLANREGTLSKFVRPEIAVEVRVSDLLTSDSWDMPIRRMSLRFEPAKGWEPLLETATAVMIHPIFLRERPDKKIDIESVGMTQVTSYVEIGEEPVEQPKRELAPAQIVRRGVFAKDNKGVIAVRKYVVVDTHKAADFHYPPFVVYFTDYSPGRKEALQTMLRSASTLERAEHEIDGWLEENVKRGWSEVESARIGEAPKVQAPPPPAKKAPSKKKK